MTATAKNVDREMLDAGCGMMRGTGDGGRRRTSGESAYTLGSAKRQFCPLIKLYKFSFGNMFIVQYVFYAIKLDRYLSAFIGEISMKL